MKKVSLTVVALVMIWHSKAMAQVWPDPYAPNDSVQLQRTNGGARAEIPKTIWSHPKGMSPYTGKELTGEPSRYFQQYESRSGAGLTGYYESQYPYQYNPYRLRW